MNTTRQITTLSEENRVLFPTSNITVIQVSLADRHSLVLTNDGVVYSFGLNQYGQLGLRHTMNMRTPFKIESLISWNIMHVTAIGSTDHPHSLVISTEGRVFGFGSNSRGQLGLGEVSSRSIPTLIPLSKRIARVTGGEGFSLFLADDGCLYSTGWNNFGQLGLNDTISRNIPTEMIQFRGMNITNVRAKVDSVVFELDNKCFGISHQDSRVCSGIGKCITGNKCDCNGTHSGLACEVWHCNSIPYTDSSKVCSGKGSCTQQNICSCHFLAIGTNCQASTLQILAFGYGPVILIPLVPLLLMLVLDISLIYANCVYTNRPLFKFQKRVKLFNNFSKNSESKPLTEQLKKNNEIK